MNSDDVSVNVYTEYDGTRCIDIHVTGSRGVVEVSTDLFVDLVRQANPYSKVEVYYKDNLAEQLAYTELVDR